MASLSAETLTDEQIRRHPIFHEGYNARMSAVALNASTNPYGGQREAEGKIWTYGYIQALHELFPHNPTWQRIAKGPPIFSKRKQKQLRLL